MDAEKQSEMEATRQQEQQIEREIAETIPYVSEKIPVTILRNDYQTDDEIYQNKLKQLEKEYSFLRRTRPDGNCFFRAFSFAYLESLIGDKTEIERFTKVIEQSKDTLVRLGFPQFTVEDFYDILTDILKRLHEGKIDSEEKLINVFYEQAISDYIVVYLRLVTSGYLQDNEETFRNFIVGSPSISEFCKIEVEPMFKESDHIHVVAITSALNIFTRIIHMDRASSDIPKHDFPEQERQPNEQPRIHLLYRPGHYDVLYSRQQNYKV